MSNISSSSSLEEKKKLQPKLRFKDKNGMCSSSWKSKKLSELFIFQNGINAESERYGSGTKYISVSDILNNDYITYESIKGSIEINDNTLKKYSVEYGDVLFQRSSETPEDIGRANVYLDHKSCTFGGFVIRGKKKSIYNPVFINALLKTKEARKQTIRLGAGAQHYNIGQESLASIELYFPTIEEQNKIANYFERIDTLLKQLRIKEELLKKYKKGLLQKMFPRNGAVVPELRFPGFNDDWEQRKLLECAEFRRGSFPQPYGNKEWYDGEGAMPFVQVADVSDDMKLVEDTKQKISKLAQPMSVYAEKNSVLVTLQGSIGRVAITQYGAFVDRTILIFDKYNNDINKLFWAYIIKEKFKDEAKKAPGGTIKTITKEVLSDFDLMLPNYNEQKRIGEYFYNLDHLIRLHQKKCNLLLKYKKGLLQQMFI